VGDILILPAISVCLSRCHKSCPLHIFATACQTLPKLGTNILLIEATCRTNQGHNHLKVTARGQRSWMSKSCSLHIFAMPHQISTKIGTNILLLNTTCRTKVTSRSRSWLQVKGHECPSLQCLIRF